MSARMQRRRRALKKTWKDINPLEDKSSLRRLMRVSKKSQYHKGLKFGSKMFGVRVKKTRGGKGRKK